MVVGAAPPSIHRVPSHGKRQNTGCAALGPRVRFEDDSKRFSAQFCRLASFTSLPPTMRSHVPLRTAIHSFGSAFFSA